MWLKLSNGKKESQFPITKHHLCFLRHWVELRSSEQELSLFLFSPIEFQSEPYTIR